MKFLSIRVPVVQGVNTLMKRVFERSGFEWVEQKIGEHEFAYWRRIKPRGKKPYRRLVFVPGFGDTSMSWYLVAFPLIGIIHRHYDEVVMLEFPGFAGFLTDKKAFDHFDKLVECFGDLMDLLTPHTMIGHSLGGWLTATYATECGEGRRPKSTKYPGPEKIILVAPAGVCFNMREVLLWQKRFYSVKDRGFSWFKQFICKNPPMWFNLVTAEFEKFFYKKEIDNFIQSIGVEHFLNKRAEHIKARTWLVWGDEDSLVPTPWVYDWLKALDHDKVQSKGVFLHDCGHSPQIEKTLLMSGVLGRLVSNRPLHEGGFGLEKGSWSFVSEDTPIKTRNFLAEEKA